MPKARKIRSNALTSQSVRHEPLGQVIEGDSIRGKYAPPSRGRRKNRKGENEEDEFLDDKTSKKILDMTNEQKTQMEIEERFEMHRKRDQQGLVVMDSDDEEEEVETEEIFIDEEDE